MERTITESLSDFDRKYLPKFCQKHQPESYAELLYSLRAQQDIEARLRAALERIDQ